uniref:Uncharacterized protein n=1 Tax=Trichinella nativa TaxID=6335 RepID=A0A0V1KGU4_9BILA
MLFGPSQRTAVLDSFSAPSPHHTHVSVLKVS